MIEATNATAVFAIAVLVAVCMQVASTHIRLPPIVLWLLAGMALGPFGFHLIHVEAVSDALYVLIELGLAIILFEGGLNLNLRALREHGWIVGRLVLLGPLVTTAGGGWAAHALTGMDWPLSLLLGALAAIGGPTVIAPIVQQLRLDRELRHILVGEAMLVEAVGAILAIVMLQLVITPTLEVTSLLQVLFMKCAIGAVVGWTGAWLLSKALSSPWLMDPELRTISTLACAWGLFVLADSLSAQAGLLAVLVAGATLQREDLPDIQRLRNFKASLSVLLISVLFVLLAAGLDLSVLVKHITAGASLFIILALIIRPVVALLAGLGSKLTGRQIVFLAGMAPRGIVVAGITSLFTLILMENGHPGAELMQALLYIIIVVSVMVYGFAGKPMSRWLEVEGCDDRSLLVIGGGQFGAEAGRALSDDREVRFLDLNAQVANSLHRAGFAAVRGNALDPLYMGLIHAEEVSAVLIMTGSSDHNLLIARLAHDEFHIRDIYVTLQEGDEEKHARLIHQLQTKRLFAKPYNFTYWNDQAMRKRLVYETRTVIENSGLIDQRLADVRIPHGVQPLAIARDGQTHIPHDNFILQAGDEIRMLLRPERIQEGQPLIFPPKSEHRSPATQEQAA